MPLWGAIAGWHSGVPVLGAGWVVWWGAIRGCCGAMVGAIAGCHVGVPLLGAMLSHCWGAISGCHGCGAIRGCHWCYCWVVPWWGAIASDHSHSWNAILQTV